MVKISKQFKVIQIISGGQTGVDRAALDVAIELGIQYGGFCPKGRLAEDGIIPDKYKVTELGSSEYLTRTFENVQASDGTLIIHTGSVVGGTLTTRDYCQMLSKPFFEINLLEDHKNNQVNFDIWLKEYPIIILNIAGPREAEEPIYERTFTLLMELLSQFNM